MKARNLSIVLGVKRTSSFDLGNEARVWTWRMRSCSNTTSN